MSEGDKSRECLPVEVDPTIREGSFTETRLHAALAALGTSRWARFFGYGILLVACRVVRTIIQA
ncbi:MAG TPA: hypothetical protein VE288_04050 [Rubrobacteraceae bacterium]|jgi:hypothetical protein|nr:hypothetical protein [Rubrobacteraceae bacterium]